MIHKVYGYVDEHLEEAVDLLIRLVLADSIKFHALLLTRFADLGL